MAVSGFPARQQPTALVAGDQAVPGDAGDEQLAGAAHARLELGPEALGEPGAGSAGQPRAGRGRPGSAVLPDSRCLGGVVLVPEAIFAIEADDRDRVTGRRCS
jgi:hypothetical protein